MSHLQGLTSDTHYRRADLKALEKMAKSKFHPMSRKRARLILDAVAELATDRHRIKTMAHELNEWRWKIGGSSESWRGDQAMNAVRVGLRNVTGRVPLPLCDDDFKG